MLTFFRHYGLSLCVALTIMYMCMMPAAGAPAPFDGFDKIVHGLMYVVLAGVVCKDFWQEGADFDSVKLGFWGLVAPCLYGGLIEIMQANLTTTRSGDWMDFFADCIGAGIGFVLARIIVPKYLERNEN